MGEFTAAEIERINKLYGTDFEGITPEDAKLIARWEAHKAEEDARYKAECEARQAQVNAHIEILKTESESLLANLNSMAAIAKARLENIESKTPIIDVEGLTNGKA